MYNHELVIVCVFVRASCLQNPAPALLLRETKADDANRLKEEARVKAIQDAEIEVTNNLNA